MIDVTDRWVGPGLALLAEWSFRWGLVLGLLALWFALKPPRRAATRHLLCTVALAAGVVLPLLPAWWAAIVPWPARPAAHATRTMGPPALEHVERSGSEIPPGAGAVAQVSTIGAAAPSPRAWPAAPPREALGPRRVAMLGIAGFWLASVLVLAVRLAGGRVLLARLRATATPAGTAAEGLLGECRRVLRLSRPVGLAVHPAAASPVAIGGLRPLILVPPDWPDWPEPHRRACLLHELTHLARRDDWAKLAQELVRVPLFFHPLLIWLLRRLDRERELLCDEAVVGLGASSLGYARLLLELSRRPGRLLPAAVAWRPGWLPFFDRGTVAVRIERLLEDDMTRSLPPPSRGRLFVMGVLAFAAALGIGGLNVRAEPQATPAGRSDPPAAQARPVTAPTRKLEGVTLQPDGKPAAGASVVVRIDGPGEPARQVLEADEDGRFSATIPDGEIFGEVIAHRDGFAPAFETLAPRIQAKLGALAPFSATLVDGRGRPIVGARVRVDMIAESRVLPANAKGVTQTMTCFSYVHREAVEGTPLSAAFEATTGRDGSFTLRASRPGTWLRLVVTRAGGAEMLVKAEKPVASPTSGPGFVGPTSGPPARLVALPAARIAGRVVTEIRGLKTAGLKIFFQASRTPGAPLSQGNFVTRDVRTGDDGRFVIDGLGDGMVNVFVHGEGENRAWTYRAARDVVLKSGVTADVAIELIRGVEVSGTVVARGMGTPLAGANVGVYGPWRPRSGAMTLFAATDAQGRYHYRLPPGETYFYVMGPPAGFATLAGKGSDLTVTIPDGAARYVVPPLEVAAAVGIGGRVLDASGAPVAGATVVGTCQGGLCTPFPGADAVTDARGVFRLPAGGNGNMPVGQAARLLIRLRDGAEHEAAAIPGPGGQFTVKLAALAALPTGVEGPRDVAADEIAGVVVDAHGRPLEGVEAHAWHWVPGHVTRTDGGGRFRLTKLSPDGKVEVRFRRQGYETQFHLDREVGRPGWVVVLGNTTYFEGRVLDPDGKPVADAPIRANGGPRQGSGFMLSETYTDTRAGADGHYRLYVEPGRYDIEVRRPGVGVAGLMGETIGADEVRATDIRLTPGIRFVARMVDHETGEPVPGVRLSHWDKPGIEGTSDAAGRVEIRDVPPGKYPRFQVKADGYARWWSSACLSEWGRYQKDAGQGFQRNFDGLDFEVGPGSKAVMIVLERAATVRGRVLDPDGKPVAGATVAPALTGTGNSLTGDTRFSVETKADGTFTMSLPASGDRDYNLVAHDGKFGEWRTWANGVLAPFRTRAGQEVRDVELRLTRPAIVRGRVTDVQGKPVAGREVRASAVDRLENRYYDPTTRTAADGTYELKFVRAGEQFIQAAPFWLDAAHAPERTSVTVSLKPDEVKEGVNLQAQPGR